MGKGRLEYFSPKCKTRIFSVSYVVLFGYDTLVDEGTVKFLVKFGAISPFPRKLGDEVTNPITGY